MDVNSAVPGSEVGLSMAHSPLYVISVWKCKVVQKYSI